jgi:putative transposase
MEAAADELAPLVGRAGACAAVGLSRAGWYRRHRHSPLPAPPPPAVAPKPPRPQPRALSPAERDKLNAVLHEERFVDLAPAEVYATLLDEGVYVGSISTMYRELHRRHGGVAERRRQATHPAHSRPELHACRPNELWSWDVSKLRGPGRGDWFFLYWILDVYSRYAVGWCVTEHETAVISERLITDTITTHHVDATALTIHADRGAQQTAKPVAQLYADLGITRSHSRPRVSNDNPYSEAGFKTFKYRPDFPTRFDSLDHAVTHTTGFFDWYNLEHHHWGLALLTPAQVHYDQVDTVIAHRQTVLDAAHAANPERFVRKPPIAKRPPDEAWINRPNQEDNSTH